MTKLFAVLLIVAGCAIGQTAKAPQTTKTTPKAEASAPTLEQCRADASRWMAEPVSKKDWSVEVIVPAAKEMLYCEMDYQHDPAHPEFAQLERQLQDVIATRYQHFLERQQFLDEDAKGER